MFRSTTSLNRPDLKEAGGLAQHRAVLCATHATSRSDAAVARASVIAHELGAELLLLHVIDSRLRVRAARRRSALACSILDAHTRAIARSGVSVKMSVRSGRPHEVIANAALEIDAELIVLGANRRRFADSLRGTRAELIASKAERPVLVVNSQSTSPYRRVLLTSDLSGMTAGAARVTDELGLLKRSRTSIVHALEHTRKTMLYLAGVDESDVANYQRSLLELASDEIDVQLFSAGLDAKNLEIFSLPASPLHAIEQTAERMGSDLIVVGCSRFAALKRMFSVSVSNQLLQNSERDVLLISPAAARRVRHRTYAVARYHLESELPQQALRLH